MVGTERYKTVVDFCDTVKKASNGRLIIEPFGAGVLFPVYDSLDSVKNGIVQAAFVWSGYWSSKDPTFAILGNRPGCPITNFSEEMYFEEKVMPVKEKLYKKYGVTYLGTLDYMPPEILCSVVPIKKLGDFKGKNIRTGGIGALFYKALGANTVSVAAPEIYTALQMKTIDAAEFSDWKENMDMGLNEVTKFVIEPCLHLGSNEDKGFIINTKAWNSLPNDLKEIVISARDHSRYRSAITNPPQSTIAKHLWAKKVKTITLSQADVEKARVIGAKVILEQAKKTPEGKEYIAIYAKVLNELGYTSQAKALGYK
ncbi:MAG: TRAP transporter substrate-binding protein DctP [Tannerellaceae bacterium]